MKKLLVILLLCGMVSCKKKNQTQAVSEHPVPYVPVSITLYPNDPLHFNVQNIGGWEYLDGGINGIILYRKSEQEFVALERSSSYLPGNPNARALVMPDNFILIDTVSGSRWKIIDGVVTQGPATWPLRLYGANYDGNVLRIQN